MRYRGWMPRDVLAQLDQMQRDLNSRFELSYTPTIRGAAGAFPAMNVGGTAKSLEVYAFAPGIDPASVEVQLEKGVLSIAGERKLAPVPEGATVHIDERFAGRFRRVVSLPDDVDPDAVEASYRDGVLHIRVGRKTAAQPRRIVIQ